MTVIVTFNNGNLIASGCTMAFIEDNNFQCSDPGAPRFIDYPLDEIKKIVIDGVTVWEEKR